MPTKAIFHSVSISGIWKLEKKKKRKRKNLVQNMFLTNFFWRGHYCPDSSSWYPAVAGNNQGNILEMALLWPETSSNINLFSKMDT